MNNPIYTIGYEKADIGDFIDTLQFWDIELLLDVRELPISRRKGFSKNKLSSHLAEANIDYLHLKSLGDPKPGRDAAKSGNYNEFTKVFSQHLTTATAKEGISKLKELIAEFRVCLMCYERDHRYCHRHLLIEHVNFYNTLDVHHLGVFPLPYLKERGRNAATRQGHCSN